VNRTSKKCGLLAIALTAVSVTANLPVHAASAYAVGWQLKQASKIHGDDITVLITDLGFKWSNPQTGVTIICQPPTWNVVAFGAKTKRYCQTPLQSFHCHAQSAIRVWAGYAFDELKLNKTGQSKANGFAFDEYGPAVAGGKSKHQEAVLLYRQTGFSFAQLKSYRGMPHEKEVGLLLSRLYNLPEKPGIPFIFRFRRKTYDVLRESLTTQSIAAARKPISEFSSPRGYKRVGTFGELMNDSAAANGVEGLMDSLGKPLYK